MFGLDYSNPGRHTEEYVQIVASLLAGESAQHDGVEFKVHTPALPLASEAKVSLLVSALAPRLLRVAGTYADGTVLWMANAKAVERHVVPRIRKAAADAGRPDPRIVVGLPVSVHDDINEAREVAARLFAVYAQLPNYQRILAYGDVAGPAEAAIVGDEGSVSRQVQALFDAGATDVWAAPFPAAEDGKASRQRTRALLKELAAS